MNKRNLWLEVNNITLKEVAKEKQHALHQRKLHDLIEKSERALWKNSKTRDRKVI